MGMPRYVYAIMEKLPDRDIYRAFCPHGGLHADGMSPYTAMVRLETSILRHLRDHQGCEEECSHFFYRRGLLKNSRMISRHIASSRALQYDVFPKEKYPYLEHDIAVILLNPEMLDAPG